MDDYISRKDAVEWFMSFIMMDEDNIPADVVVGDLKTAIPAADVEPVRHGRWMHEETEGGFHIWSCSRCGRGMNGNPKGTNLYCYHGGAKMDLI